MDQKKTKLLVSLAGIGILFFAVQWYWQKGRSTGPEFIHISGNVEVTDAEVSFKIAGKVKERLVSEGETVTKGQIVAFLESQDLAQEVAIQEAEVQAARANLEELLAGSRPEEIGQAKAALEKARSLLERHLAGSRREEIAALEATLEKAKADRDHLKQEMARYKNLFEDGVVSAEKFDDTKTNYEMAQAQVKEAKEMLQMAQEGPRKEDIEQARAALQEAEQKYLLVKKGPRKEDIDETRARLSRAQAALTLAKTRLGYTEITAPLSGVVLSENIESGEYVVAGTPIVTIGDLEHAWVRGYVNETDLGRVKVGQPVRVFSDTFPGEEYRGKVSFISSQAEFTPKTVQTKKERVKLVFRIKVDIYNGDMELKPGMPVDAEINVKEIPKWTLP
jgi:HlyD family secretion protein